MTDDAPHLLTQEQDGILIATLNRPDKLNALSAETMALFEAALIRFRDTPDLKVMLIRSTGRYFCSGADMKSGGSPREYPRTPSGIRENHRLQLNGMQRIYDEMEHVEKPIVCAIHAPASAGGWKWRCPATSAWRPSRPPSPSPKDCLACCRPPTGSAA